MFCKALNKASSLPLEYFWDFGSKILDVTNGKFGVWFLTRKLRIHLIGDGYYELNRKSQI